MLECDEGGHRKDGGSCQQHSSGETLTQSHRADSPGFEVRASRGYEPRGAPPTRGSMMTVSGTVRQRDHSPGATQVRHSPVCAECNTPPETPAGLGDKDLNRKPFHADNPGDW